MHKSQGFGVAPSARAVARVLRAARRRSRATAPTSSKASTPRWSRVPGGEAIGELLQQAARRVRSDEARRRRSRCCCVDDSTRALDGACRDDPWTALKQRELADADRSPARASSSTATRRDSSRRAGRRRSPVNVTVVNRSPTSVHAVEVRVALRRSEQGRVNAAARRRTAAVKTKQAITLPADCAALAAVLAATPPPSRASYARRRSAADRRAREPARRSRSTSRFDRRGQRRSSSTRPVVYKWTDPVAGRALRAPSRSRPPVTVQPGRGVLHVPRRAAEAGSRSG